MVFPVTGNGVIQETLGRVLDPLRAALPAGWRANLVGQETGSDSGLDAVVRISSPTGQNADFGVLVKATTPRSWLLRALRGLPAIAEANGYAGLVVFAWYLSAPVRAELESAGVGYADSTGWVRLVSERPMLAITARGADRAPGADTRRQTLSLKGASAGRIVRALLSCTPPVGVRELAEIAGVSPGSVSKTLPLLAAENGVRREAGKITGVNRREVLRRWTLDYRILVSNGRPAYFVAPRGIDTALADALTAPRLAVTGSQAGALWLPEGTAPLVPVTQLIIYTAEVTTTASSLGLVAVDAPSANTILLVPQDLAILDSPDRKDDTPLAPLPLVLADLMTLPGRYPQQAGALMDALAKTDPAWRPR